MYAYNQTLWVGFHYNYHKHLWHTRIYIVVSCKKMSLELREFNFKAISHVRRAYVTHPTRA